MANIREWLEEAEILYGERIEAMVVGEHYDRMFDDKPLPNENIILSRQDGLTKVDQEYDNGYGGADCFPLYAWTASRVFLVHEYDGATGPIWVPRHPMALEPSFGGQSTAVDMILTKKVEPSEAMK